MFATRNPHSVLAPDTPSPPSRNKPLLQSKQDRKRPALPENVTITCQAPSPDTAGRTVVNKNLVESLGATVEVSPARSACSETDVHINTDFQSLISLAKTELRSEFQGHLNNVYERIKDLEQSTARIKDLEQRTERIKDLEQRTSALEMDGKHQVQRVDGIETGITVGLGVTSFEEWNRKMKRQTEFVNRIAISTCMRSVEDLCFRRMRKVIGSKSLKFSLMKLWWIDFYQSISASNDRTFSL